MKKYLIALFVILCAKISFSQVDTIKLKSTPETGMIVTDRPPQAVYFGLGGSGPILSVNYDRRFNKRLNGPGFAAGIGFWGSSGESLFSVPVSINYLFGKRTNFLEIAAGATYYSYNYYPLFDGDEDDKGTGVFGHFNFGYRLQPANGGFFLRTGISPLFEKNEYVTSFYLGLGLAF